MAHSVPQDLDLATHLTHHSTKALLQAAADHLCHDRWEDDGGAADRSTPDLQLEQRGWSVESLRQLHLALKRPLRPVRRQRFKRGFVVTGRGGHSLITRKLTIRRPGNAWNRPAGYHMSDVQTTARNRR